MSKDVGRDQVLKTTKVRTSLKNDGSWIHKSKQEQEGEDKARTDSAALTRPVPVKNKSFVISAAKKFESTVSTDSPLNPPLKKTPFTPSEGDSAKQGNVKALAKELNLSVEEQQKKFDPKTVVKNKNAHAVTPLDLSNVNCSKAKVSEDAHVKDPAAESSVIAGAEKSKDPTKVPDLNTVQLKPKEETSTVTKPENATNLDHAGVKSVEQPAKESCKTSPAKHVAAETVEAEAKVTVNSSSASPAVNNATPKGKAALQHSVEPVSDTVSKSPTQSADTRVKDPVAGTSAVAGTEKKKDPAQVSAQAIVELKPERPPTVTTPANVVETEGKVTDNASPKAPAVNKTEKPPAVTEPVNATSVDHAETKSTAPPASESCKSSSPKQITAKTVETEGKVADNSSPETPAVNNTKPKEKPALQPVPDTVSKSPTQSSDAHGKDPAAGTSAVAGTEKKKDPAQVSAQAIVELKPEKPPAVTEPANATSLDHAETKSTAPPASESCKTSSPKQVTAKTVEAEATVVVKVSPETSVANNATPGGKPALQHSVEPGSDTVSKSPTQSAADTAIKSAKSKVKSEAPAEPLLKTRPDEVVEYQTQPGNTAVKPSMNQVSVNAASHVMESGSKDTVRPVTTSEGGAAQDNFTDRTIELTDALDEAPATAESVPKPVNDPKQSHSEGSKPNQCDDTNNTEKFQKPKEEPRSTFPVKKTRNVKDVCSFCNQVIVGNVKIKVSDPPVTCHSGCLKCGVCHKDLGDLLTPMFLHDQLIHCKGCFAKALMP